MKARTRDRSTGSISTGSLELEKLIEQYGCARFRSPEPTMRCTSGTFPVSCENPLIDGNMNEPLRCRMRHSRAVRQFLGDCERRILQSVVGDDQVDETPALKGRGVVAPPEHRDLFGAHSTGALHLPLDAAWQGVDPSATSTEPIFAELAATM